MKPASTADGRQAAAELFYGANLTGLSHRLRILFIDMCRRMKLPWMFALTCLLWAAQPAPGANLINAQADEAIKKGLAYLARRQQSDGRWGNGSSAVAVTALGGMALMSAGNTPAEGEYAENVKRAADFLVSICDPKTGYFSYRGSNMYSQGFATVFLAEVVGTTSDKRMREALTRAVKLIETAQNPQGGWRYNPVPIDADISVTICCLMGLRAARNAGIKVSKKTIAAAVNYVKGCQNLDGSFTYMFHGQPLKHRGGGGYARTAAGLCSLFFTGVYEGREVEAALKFLRSQYRKTSQSHFMYASYYAAQAFHQAGGDDWRNYYTFMRDYFLKRQRADGSWHGRVSVEYTTSMALIILQMPNELLPIFQR